MFATFARRIIPTRAAAPVQAPSMQPATDAAAQSAASWFESSWELLNGIEVCEREFDPRDFQFA